jgi:hypothetical protein
VGSSSVAFGTTITSIPTYLMDGDFTHRGRPLPTVFTADIAVRELSFKSRCKKEAGGKPCKNKCPYLHQTQVNSFSKDKIEALPVDYQNKRAREKAAKQDF